MLKKYFGTDGIRGTVNIGNINGEKFFNFGLAAGTYFKNLKKKKQVAIIKTTIMASYLEIEAIVAALCLIILKWIYYKKNINQGNINWHICKIKDWEINWY